MLSYAVRCAAQSGFPRILCVVACRLASQGDCLSRVPGATDSVIISVGGHPVVPDTSSSQPISAF